jgi:aerobic-type carbon monoxide dehydrogenase small subunit (CoxS/CutS family)
MNDIKLRVNGIDYRLKIEPWRTLVEVLRENLGLMGTKKACNEGECGACTVIMDGRAVTSCLMLAIDARGKEIQTIEGLSEGERILYTGHGHVGEGALG